MQNSSFTYIIILLLLPFMSQAESAGERQILNSLAPAFTLPDNDNQLHSLSNWKGKLVIINFWATWCTPCKKEIPLLNTIKSAYDSDDFQLVGIAIDNKNAVNEFIKLFPIEYINLIGGLKATKLVSRYGNRAGVLPYTIVVNPQGEIVSVAQGLLTEKYLRNTIEKYL